MELNPSHLLELVHVVIVVFVAEPTRSIHLREGLEVLALAVLVKEAELTAGEQVENVFLYAGEVGEQLEDKAEAGLRTEAENRSEKIETSRSLVYTL